MIKNYKKFEKQAHRDHNILEHLLMEDYKGSAKKREFAAFKIISNNKKFEKQTRQELKVLERLLMEESSAAPGSRSLQHLR